MATVTSFPLSKHPGGGGTPPAFSGRRVYLQFTWEVPLPHSPVELSSHGHFYKLSHSKVAGWGPPLLPCPPACLFTVPWGNPALFATCLFFCCLLFSFFSLFSLSGGQSVQGAMLMWSRVVCGSTACRLAHLVIWRCESPPGFSF
jgi:hypothetical protein